MWIPNHGSLLGLLLDSLWTNGSPTVCAVSQLILHPQPALLDHQPLQPISHISAWTCMEHPSCWGIPPPIPNPQGQEGYFPLKGIMVRVVIRIWKSSLKLSEDWMLVRYIWQIFALLSEKIGYREERQKGSKWQWLEEKKWDKRRGLGPQKQEPERRAPGHWRVFVVGERLVSMCQSLTRFAVQTFCKEISQDNPMYWKDIWRSLSVTISVLISLSPLIFVI